MSWLRGLVSKTLGGTAFRITNTSALFQQDSERNFKASTTERPKRIWVIGRWRVASSRHCTPLITHEGDKPQIIGAPSPTRAWTDSDDTARGSSIDKSSEPKSADHRSGASPPCPPAKLVAIANIATLYSDKPPTRRWFRKNHYETP